MDNDNVVYGVDGNQCTAYREGFTNLQECDCGFGDTDAEALADLLWQEGKVSNKI